MPCFLIFMVVSIQSIKCWVYLVIGSVVINTASLIPNLVKKQYILLSTSKQQEGADSGVAFSVSVTSVLSRQRHTDMYTSPSGQMSIHLRLVLSHPSAAFSFGAYTSGECVSVASQSCENLLQLKLHHVTITLTLLFVSKTKALCFKTSSQSFQPLYQTVIKLKITQKTSPNS